MSSNQKRSLLLSPILLSMLATSAAHAEKATVTENQVSISVKTSVTRADVEFNVAAAEHLMESAKKDSVATQCSLYSVDSGGHGHCAFYDSQSAPSSNAVSMHEFDV